MVKYKLKEELQARTYKRLKEIEVEFDVIYQEFLKIALEILENSEHIKESSDRGNNKYTFSYCPRNIVQTHNKIKILDKFNQSDITDLELKSDGSYNSYKFCW